MSLYAIYLIIFSVASIIGVPLLSVVQTTQVHRKTITQWLSSFPLTIAIAVGMIILISIIMYFVIHPMDKTVKKAEEGSISEEEKYAFIKRLKLVKLVSYLTIYIGYVIGNGTAVIIKGLKGVVWFGDTPAQMALTAFIILVLCLVYAVIETYYCTHFFEVLAQSKIRTLNITDVKDMKVERFTASIGFVAFGFACFAAWHMLCTAYGFYRFAGKMTYTMKDFILSAVLIFVWGIVAPTPMVDYILINLRKRFNITAEKITNLKDEGDLVSRIQLASFDDFGKLNSELNKFMNYLNTLVKNVKNENDAVFDNASGLEIEAHESSAGITQIVNSFHEINTKNDTRDKLLDDTQNNIIELDDEANKISELVSSQATAIEENASSITEMVANIKSMLEMIRKAKTVSEELSQVSEKGIIEVDNTLQKIQTLAEKSERMSEITRVIQSVASQTNLLAMNAAIEAAHAGEAGSGFSVVADEIRNLAESTSKSTKEIKVLIDDMIDVVDEGTRSMTATSEVFNSINQGVKDQSQVVETIANAMEEQSIGAGETLTTTNEISSQTSDINTLVQSQTKHNGEIKNAINDCVALSQEVNESLAQSNTVIGEFEQTMKHITESTAANKQSVERVASELSRFKLE